MSTPVTIQRSLALLVAACLALVLMGTSAQAAPAAGVRDMQKQLVQLGYPIGAVDGVEGPQTRRGVCAWRQLHGHQAHRGSATKAERAQIVATTRLPKAKAGAGVTVDQTCQTVYFRDGGAWKKVMVSSTGKNARTPNGEFKVQRVRAGWHTSSLYPAPKPNMYNTMYFNGAIALHGARSVPSYPDSAGCARLRPTDADWLFARVRTGTPVSVIGRY